MYDVVSVLNNPLNDIAGLTAVLCLGHRRHHRCAQR